MITRGWDLRHVCFIFHISFICWSLTRRHFSWYFFGCLLMFFMSYFDFVFFRQRLISFIWLWSVMDCHSYRCLFLWGYFSTLSKSCEDISYVFTPSIVPHLTYLTFFSSLRNLSCQRITLHKNLFFSFVFNSLITIIFYTCVANNQEVTEANPVSTQHYSHTVNFFSSVAHVTIYSTLHIAAHRNTFSLIEMLLYGAVEIIRRESIKFQTEHAQSVHINIFMISCNRFSFPSHDFH